MTGLIWAACGTGFTFFMTALGAGLVIFMHSDDFSDKVRKAFLGFAAGVMIAASVWSLLIPAIEESENSDRCSWLPAVGGFALGVVFLMSMDIILPLISEKAATAKHGHTAMLVLAITLHNIPEGMAVGIAFAAAAQSTDSALFGAAAALAVGMGIQNFPEGAAIAIPLRQNGMSRMKAFICGAASGIVEPVFGILTVFAVNSAQLILPWLLSFAAGAMIYVAADELIPAAHTDDTRTGTLSVMVGFLLMMALDTAL